MEANLKTMEDIQDRNDVVIVGSDVCALYPSLNDMEVAIICYQAILDSDIKFLNFNYEVASKYIAMHLTEEEQRRSPLYRVLPRRTTRNGVKPGVSAKPKNDKNWLFPAKERTEFEERLIVATAVQIGILTMMSTHRYSFNGDTYLQKSGGVYRPPRNMRSRKSGDEYVGYNVDGKDDIQQHRSHHRGPLHG